MNIKQIIIKLILIFLVSMGFISPDRVYADSRIGELDFKNCKVSDVTGKTRIQAECAVLPVPENYSEPNGKKIDIHIARFKSKSNKKRDDAFTLLAGGPGQGAIETFATAVRTFRKIRAQQDIFLIDQRGTGKSNPFQCDFSDEDTLAAQFEFDAELTKRLARECIQEFSGDASQYTTSVAMRDLDLVREKLGLKKWNLYGGSYGTRTAQHYTKEYPEHVRTVILDGLVSPDRPLGPEISTESQKSLDELLERCANDEACNEAFPDLTAKTNQLITDLKASPRTVNIENLASGQLEEFQFGLPHLAGGIRMALYNPAMMSILPNLIYSAAANNHYAPIARQSINSMRSLIQAMNMGMHNSVICTEDAPAMDKVDIDRDLLARSYMGEDFEQFIEATCSVWPAGPIDDGFHDLVQTDIPILLLSGGQDPVTPPEYAEQAMQKMSNSKHIVIEGQGHIQAMTGCVPTIMAKFIETKTFDEFKMECLDKIQPEPFFIDFNGPKP